jgi:hypothetical protein
MTDFMQYKNLITAFGFSQKENTSGIYFKKYAGSYTIELDFES